MNSTLMYHVIVYVYYTINKNKIYMYAYSSGFRDICQKLYFIKPEKLMTYNFINLLSD